MQFRVFPSALALMAMTACSQSSPSTSTGTAPSTPGASMTDTAKAGTANVHSFTVESLDGQSVPLSQYKGKAVLIVNTASECGYTPQYASLQKLYASYKDQGLEVLAFPSNDFGEQEPGDAATIQKFVDDKYNVEFPLFAKVHATGDDKAPLYKTLTEETPRRNSRRCALELHQISRRPQRRRGRPV